MTGTDLCVNKPQSVPVIFEPPCIKNVARFTQIATTIVKIKAWDLLKHVSV